MSRLRRAAKNLGLEAWGLRLAPESASESESSTLVVRASRLNCAGETPAPQNLQGWRLGAPKGRQKYGDDYCLVSYFSSNA